MLDTSKAENEIRGLVKERVEATRAKDVARASWHFSEDIVIFDVVNPLRSHGIESAANRAKEWFASFEGPIGFDVFDLDLTVGDGVAFSTSLNHVHAVTVSGTLDMWWRSTTGYRNIDGSWKVTHEHNSVPFDPATGKASLDLRPEES